MKQTKRIEWLDFSKGVVIFWVVIYHVLYLNNYPGRELFNYISNLSMMPIFFAISGYLYKPTNTVKKYMSLIYKKVVGFIIPYFIFNLLLVLMQNNYNLYIIVKYWYRIFIYPCGYLWFLYVLFFIFLIMGLINLLHISLYIQVMLVLTLGYMSVYNFKFQRLFIIRGNKLTSFLGLLDPLHSFEIYVSCFLLGYILKKYAILNKINISKRLWIFILLCWLIALIVGRKCLSKIPVAFNNVFIIIFQLCNIIILFILFKEYNHNLLFKYFTKYGKYTLLIYLIHYPIIFIVIRKFFIFNHMQYLLNKPMFMIPINFVLGYGISIIVCKLLKKHNIIKIIFYPRYYIDKLFIKTRLGKYLL